MALKVLLIDSGGRRSKSNCAQKMDGAAFRLHPLSAAVGGHSREAQTGHKKGRLGVER